MNTKNFILISFLNLTSICSYGQVEKDSLRTVQDIERKAEIIPLEAMRIGLRGDTFHLYLNK